MVKEFNPKSVRIGGKVKVAKVESSNWVRLPNKRDSKGPKPKPPMEGVG